MNQQIISDQKVVSETKPFCLFCKMANDLKIAEFEYCYAILDQFPVSKGHVLIIPKEHAENWFTAPERVKIDILNAIEILKIRLDEQFHPDGYNIGMNCGAAAGQTIFHLHVHLIPRYIGDMEDPRGGVRGVIPNRQKY